MNDETPIDEQKAAGKRDRRLPGHLPEPLERIGFGLQERVVWPLQDRFGHHGTGPSRTALLGGGAAAFLAGVAVVFALTSGGGGDSTAPATTVVEAAAPSEPLTADSAQAPEPEPNTRQEPPRETLHGAAPVFSPPSPASKGGEKTGETGAAEQGAASSGSSAASGSSDAAASDS